MDQKQIEAAIQEIGRPYADKRVHVFEISIARLEGDALYLSGRVLDMETLRDLEAALGARFPGLRISVREVEVGRKATTRRRVVATNLTSLHDGTSFLAEMVTQVMNGVTIEVLWEQGRWGFARLPDGYLGWTYLPYLTDEPAPRPTHLVTAPVGLLRESPRADAPLITRVLGGTFVTQAREVEDWICLALPGGWEGWLLAENLRPLASLPQGGASRRELLAADAFRMVGVPYLWGGCSAHGIDCSGFAQLLHRWIGLTIPRDADMQFAAGQEVEPPFQVGDLLFFGESGEQRRITHVGISLGGWRIIHASRSRNGVQVDDVQSVPHLRDDYLCAATYIGR